MTILFESTRIILNKKLCVSAYSFKRVGVVQHVASDPGVSRSSRRMEWDRYCLQQRA